MNTLTSVNHMPPPSYQDYEQEEISIAMKNEEETKFLVEEQERFSNKSKNKEVLMILQLLKPQQLIFVILQNKLTDPIQELLKHLRAQTLPHLLHYQVPILLRSAQIQR